MSLCFRGLVMIDALNFIQIWLTISFTLLVITLTKTWRPSLVRAWNSTTWDHTDWLAVGIVSGFLFSVLDWGYWGVWWATVLLESNDMDEMLSSGPISNVFLRQLPGFFAVYCHLVAAALMFGKKRPDIIRPIVVGLIGTLIITFYGVIL